MPQPSEREIEVFNVALELPAAERAAYLDQASGGDPSLRERVEELLQAADEGGAFLENPATVPPKPVEIIHFGPPASEKEGGRVGPYRLLQQIGEGGCGVVYLAEQEEPVRRQVALKVIKLGMDTKSVIARFAAERQALALMDHPNIAKVFDAGATGAGRPYFAMELVRGVPITDYCDQNNLSTRARLDLFMQVCRAVQHAHQKGIIHRDIKPSNILITVNDGTPTPKVIDFGIAKATQGKLADHTVFTAFEQFIGTPAYMSPEQAEMGVLDIDTRSDIYSLGVLLYELLTGKTPFDAKELLKAGLDEMRRRIREQEPARPSTRLSGMPAADLTTVAGHRQAPPPKLIHLVRGELDCIVMKALEKDRARRYETANGFAADIQRHLDNEPVLASPAGKLYTLQKLVRRNKLAFALGTVVAVSLLLGLGVVTAALISVKRAKDDAIEKLRSSYLAQARATRTSGQTGQRFASLDLAGKAAAIRSDLAVRNEFIACLAVSDLRVARQRVLKGYPRNELAYFDPRFDHYVMDELNGKLTVRAASNNLPVAVLPAPGYTLESFWPFCADGKFLIARYSREHEGESEWVWDWERRMTVARVLKRPEESGGVGPDLASAVSPDGRLFANHRWDGAIEIYDLVLGKEVKKLHGPGQSTWLQFNPGNSRLACSGRKDSLVEILDVESGRTFRTLTNAAGVSATAWSPDGQRLAVAGMDFKIYLWEVATGRRLAVLEGPFSLIMCLAFNHAGNLLVNTSYDNVVRLWNVDTGRQMAGHRGSSWGIQFSPDDRYLVGWQDEVRYGWLEVASSKECRQLYVPRDDVSKVSDSSVPAFSADGRIVASGREGMERFWDASSGKEIGAIPLPGSEGQLFPPDGRSLITVDHIAGLRQRALEAAGPSAYRLGRPRPLLEVSDLAGASLSLDGRHLVVAREPTGQAFILDLQNPAAKRVLSGHPSANRTAISADGRWVATASWYNPLVRIWDARSGELARAMTLPARAWVDFSPDSRWLATSSITYKLWEVATGRPRDLPELGDEVSLERFTAFSPDGRVMARTAGYKIQLLDCLTEKPLAMLEAPGSIDVARFQFSPDGGKLAAVQSDQQVRLWDLRLIRQELASAGLDWDLPPYPPPGKDAGIPVTLEIEPDDSGTPSAQAETR
jgi:serine/threonine protein kinase/WD40 repeat protein